MSEYAGEVFMVQELIRSVDYSLNDWSAEERLFIVLLDEEEDATYSTSDSEKIQELYSRL